MEKCRNAWKNQKKTLGLVLTEKAFIMENDKKGAKMLFSRYMVKEMRSGV